MTNEEFLTLVLKEEGTVVEIAQRLDRVDDFIEVLERMKSKDTATLNEMKMWHEDETVIGIYEDGIAILQRQIWDLKETKFLTPEGYYKGDMGAII